MNYPELLIIFTGSGPLEEDKLRAPLLSLLFKNNQATITAHPCKKSQPLAVTLVHLFTHLTLRSDGIDPTPPWGR